MSTTNNQNTSESDFLQEDHLVVSTEQLAPKPSVKTVSGLQYTLITKGIDSGFLLDEPELRRLADIMNQQISKISSTNSLNVMRVFRIKFANGAVSRINSIDEILSIENYGSSALKEINLFVADAEFDEDYGVYTSELARNYISITFSDRDLTYREKPEPMHMSIRGTDRDWVFVTNSLIEERLNKLKIFSLDEDKLRSITLLIPMILTIIAFTIMISSFNHDAREISVDNIAQAYHSGQLRDPIEIMLKLQRASYENRPPTTPIMIILGLVIFSGMSTFWRRSKYMYTFFPSANFYWGDYQQKYDRNKARLTWIISSIFAALVVSIIAGWLVNKFHLGL